MAIDDLQQPTGLRSMVRLTEATCRPRLSSKTVWWLWPAGVFLLTRLIDAIFILIAQRHQIAVTPTVEAAGYHVSTYSPAQPGYFEVATNWDGQWYEQIAANGYPNRIPVALDGAVDQNAWAFPPLFPAAVRSVMGVLSLDFAHAAVLVSVVCSLIGVILVYRLLDEAAGRFAARATVLLLCTSMAAAALQIAYTDGAALMLLAAVLLNLRRRRYGVTAILMIVLGLTRPVALPLIFVVGAHAFELYRAKDLKVRLRPVLMLVVAAVGATALWPLTAAVVTGRITAFTDTQRAWRNGYDVGPFGVFSVAHHLGGWTAVLVCVAAAALLAALVIRPGTRRWGVELRAWALVYPLYLFAVAPAAVSLFRFSLLAFPLAWPFPESSHESRRLRGLAVAVFAVAGLFAQWYWIRHFLVLGPVEKQFALP